MKLLGFAFCVLGCLGGALRTAKNRENGILALREMCAALKLMQGELSLTSTPIPALFSLLKGRTQGSAAVFFGELSEQMDRLGEDRLAELWAASVRSRCGMLAPPEREALTELGEVLGRYDPDMQALAIDRCWREMHERLQQAEKAFPDQRRLLLGLGLSAGLLLGILLL